MASPPCSTTLASTSLRHSSSRSICSSGTPKAAPPARSQLEAKRNSWGSGSISRQRAQGRGAMGIKDERLWRPQSCVLIRTRPHDRRDAHGLRGAANEGVIADQRGHTCSVEIQRHSALHDEAQTNRCQERDIDEIHNHRNQSRCGNAVQSNSISPILTISSRPPRQILRSSSLRSSC